MNKSWDYVRLDELCDIRVGRTPRRDTPKYWGGTAVWVTIRELSGGVISESKEHVSDLAVKEIMPEPIPTGTLLFSFKLSIGKMGIAGCPLYTNEAIAALVIRDIDRLSRDFLKYALLAVNHAIGANTAVLGKVLNKEKVSAIQIPLPPLTEQERIVRLLDEAESIRATRESANVRMEQFVPALFQEMFGNSRKWKISKIGDIAQVKTGGTPSRKELKYFGGNIPWVKTTEVNQSIILDTEEKISQEGMKNSNCEIFPPETILIAMYGQGITRGRTGKLGISATTNQACAAILPSNEFDSDYLWALLQISYEKLRSLGRGGNQPNLNLSMIKNFEAILPPLALQREFAARVEAARGVQSAQGRSTGRIEALYQSMLSRAFAGEL